MPRHQRRMLIDGKSSRIVVRPHTDPGLVLGDIVHPIRTDPAQIRNPKSCTSTCSGAPLGRNSRPPFLKGPTSSFFFVSTEITGSPRESCSCTARSKCSVGVDGPGVPSPPGSSCDWLASIAHVVEQFGDHAMADLVPLALQCRRQLTHALAGPAQRGWDPHGCRLHQPRPTSRQARVMLEVELPAAQDGGLRPSRPLTAGSPNSRYETAANRPARSSGGPCNRCWPPRPGRRRLSVVQAQAAAFPLRPQRGQSLGND